MLQKEIKIGDFSIELVLDDYSFNSLQMLVSVYLDGKRLAFKTLFFKRQAN